jgi:hypothetical protein
VIVAMSHLSFILTAWIVSAAAIAAYCARLVQRGRRLTRAVPAEHRRWMTSTAEAEAGAKRR